MYMHITGVYLHEQEITMLTKLQIINDALSAVGLSHVASEDSQHPAYLKAKTAFEFVNVIIQSESWWYNRSWRVLTRDPEGHVTIPQNAVVVENTSYPNIIVRGTQLYDRDTGSIVIDGDYQYRIVEVLPIEQVPGVARNYIAAATKLKHFIDEDGNDPKLSMYRQELLQAEGKFKAEHLRHEDLNYFSGEAGRTKYPYATVMKVR
jgi:hypothetical protein